MSPELWEEEANIPDDAVLYVRVHEGVINKRGPEIGLPNEGAFYNTPKHTGIDLSSDWNKYSTPENSRELIGREYKPGKTEFKNPENFFIVGFLVKDIKDLELDQTIKHSPRQDNFPEEIVGFPWNRAHCGIYGDDEERRVRMRDIAKWEIAPSNYDPEKDERTFRH